MIFPQVPQLETSRARIAGQSCLIPNSTTLEKEVTSWQKGAGIMVKQVKPTLVTLASHFGGLVPPAVDPVPC